MLLLTEWWLRVVHRSTTMFVDCHDVFDSVFCGVVLLTVSSEVFAQMNSKLEVLLKKVDEFEHSATTFHHLGASVLRKRQIDFTRDI